MLRFSDYKDIEIIDKVIRQVFLKKNTELLSNNTVEFLYDNYEDIAKDYFFTTGIQNQLVKFYFKDVLRSEPEIKICKDPLYYMKEFTYSF